ncbi:hypothetical protein CGZ93_14170 [Enemella dayhoffiae]|uniref:DUF2079 domain-containing protein n=1 Tax=Enemella dayhoffiae TaxID=2016507 RepID=A0A255GRW8_9ACTN|nr:DUF2079 domain-containing protein [Enemella dayhoffiae]OYO18577.1 hypothetical protein CGZ93_14170 [Enemella dayhoffiae]
MFERVRRRLATQPASAWGGALGSFVIYTLLSTLQWRRYESPSWDLGIFTQVVQQYARLQPPVVHIKGADYNILGDHFHPLLAVLAPIYALAPSAYTLLVLQALLVAVSVFFIAKAAHEQLGRAGGWLIGIAYALCWGVQQAVAVQFHEVALGAPILAISLWAMLRRSWWTAAIWGGLLVFVKEDLGLTVLVLGLVLAWRSKNWLLGGGLAAWGLAMFALTTKVILPALNPKNQYDYDKYLDFSEVLANPFGHLAEILTNDKKMATVLLLLACTGFFLLRSSLGFLVLPTLAWRFLSNNDGHWGQTWHYSLLLMPIAYAAAVDGIATLRDSKVPFLKAYATHGAVVVLTFALAISNQLPLFELRNPQQWVTGGRQESAQRVLDLVPPEVTVGTDVSLMAYLVSRRDVYYIGQEGNPVEDYLVIDNVGGGWSQQVDVATYGGQIHPGTQWRKIFDENGYQVARRA